MNRSSKNRLTKRELFLFSKDTLFDKIARVICRAECLPRKELYEAWEVARRVRRRFRGGRIVDLACGHGLTAALLLLLDDSSPNALAIDHVIPPSARRLNDALAEEWPRLKNRLEWVEASLEASSLYATDLVVSVHACGQLTDLVLQKAVASRARLAVLPCCHDLDNAAHGDLRGWLDGPLAVDVARANWLQSKGYQIFTQQIPDDITPKNRLLMGEPL